MDILPIEEMPHLAARLGESGIDRIRYVGKANNHKQPNSTNIKNTVIADMQAFQPNTPDCPIDVLVSAAAYFDDNQTKPLNINRLFNILQCIELINTREVIAMTRLNARQAQKYVRAVKFIIPYLESHFYSTTKPAHSYSLTTS